MDDILRAFPAILNALGSDNAAVEHLVFAAWRRNVDGAFADNVVPVRLEGKRLIAAVASETWRRQVADLGPALVDKLNISLGTQFVSFVEFQVDGEAVAKSLNRPDNPLRRRPEFTLHSPALADAARAISDESLRSIFLAAASGSLARNAKDDGGADRGS